MVYVARRPVKSMLETFAPLTMTGFAKLLLMVQPVLLACTVAGPELKPTRV